MTIDTKKHDQHLIDFQNQLDSSMIRGTLAPPVDPEREAESLRNTDTTDMVRQVTRQIDGLKVRLSESRGFDPKTGQPMLVIAEDDPRRRALETQLHHLSTAVLPYTQAQAAEIEGRRAQLETPAQKLQAEADRQARVAAAAQRRAEEIEVEEAARRLLAQRRQAGSA